MSTIDATFYARTKGSADDAWELLPGNTLQLVSGEAMEIVCVGPSKPRRVIFESDVPTETYYFLVGGMRVRAGSDLITVGAP